MDHFVELHTIKDKYKDAWSRIGHSNTKLGEQSLEGTEESGAFQEMPRIRSLAVTHIIFEVVELLRKSNQISIGDAIWHSVTNADWRKGVCLDTVTEFPGQLTVEKRKDMFRFDRSWDGSFRYKWLLHRIMLQGGFWVGRLVQISTDHDYSDRISTKHGESDTVSRDDQVDRAAHDQQLHDKFRSPTLEHTEMGT